MSAEKEVSRKDMNTVDSLLQMHLSKLENAPDVRYDKEDDEQENFLYSKNQDYLDSKKKEDYFRDQLAKRDEQINYLHTLVVALQDRLEAKDDEIGRLRKAMETARSALDAADAATGDTEKGPSVVSATKTGQQNTEVVKQEQEIIRESKKVADIAGGQQLGRKRSELDVISQRHASLTGDTNLGYPKKPGPPVSSKSF